MAGTLTLSTISDGTTSTSATNVISGSTRAWVRYSAGSQTLLNSFNVSSVTYNSTGNYTVNLTNAMGSANYGVVTDCGTDSNSEATTNNASITSSSFGIICRGSVNTGTNYNSATISAILVAP
jgi:hypothetical protein